MFDLFGTLVAEFGASRRSRVLRDMADSVSAPPDAFERLWNATAHQRFTGAFSSIEENIRHVCAALGVRTTRRGIAEATRKRLQLMKRQMAPRPDAVSTLSRIKADGHRTGLVSVCSPEVPGLWGGSPLAPFVDVAVFSCEAGLRKPDPRIYRAACERLGVPPEQCLYVGDGSFGELSGAARVGMYAVLIRVPGDDEDVHLVEEERGWTGPAVSGLSQVLQLLGTGPVDQPRSIRMPS